MNAFTVDVEDYYHVSAFADRIEPRHWDGFESRVAANTRRLLDLMGSMDVRGTFFILGWVAERHPDVVREIDRAGHQIGCHSYWHRLVYDMTPDEFRDDLRRSCDIIAQMTGTQVTAYRAPSFSITRQSLWALEILAEEGIEFDSSIFPVVHDRYGIPDAPLQPHHIETRAGGLWEFPPSVHRAGTLRLPVGGGGYFRLYPWMLTRRWLKRINRAGRPFMFYIHPWEIDPDQPVLGGRSVKRIRHRVNLAGTWMKLARLLMEFRFATISESLNHYAPRSEAPAFASAVATA